MNTSTGSGGHDHMIDDRTKVEPSIRNALSILEELRDTVDRYRLKEIPEHYAYSNLIDMIDGASLCLDHLVDPPKCRKCGKPLHKVELLCETYDGRDSWVEHDLATIGVSDGCLYGTSTTGTWLGEDVNDDERRDYVRCPHCHGFPFGDATKFSTRNPLDIAFDDRQSRPAGNELDEVI